MAKEVTEPSLREVLSGVDMVGTMLNTDLPRLEKELSAIRVELARHSGSADPATPGSPGTPDDITVKLEEIRDLLQVQLERFDALERRVAHLASMCAQETTESSEQG